jgi:outer membrane protein assembly factor BamB
MDILPMLLLLVWNQWGGGPRHNGSLPVIADRFEAKLAETIVDPHVPVKRAEANGALLVHYQTPLSDGNEVFMEVIGGTYIGFQTWQTQTWGVRKFVWNGGQLQEQWTAVSDWKPVPSGTVGPRFEPVFHAALTGDFIYMPGRAGSVLEVSRATGAITRRLTGLGGALDDNVYVTSPITVDDGGALYYNAIRLQPGDPWRTAPAGAYLVKVAGGGGSGAVDYSTLVPDLPVNCTADFAFASVPAPWPPSPNAVAPNIVCGPPRPGINVAPAVGPDGTIYTVSRAHFNSRWGHLIAVNPDLTLKWSASLRNRFHDGCNVLLPPNGTPGGCRAGAITGVDPTDNQLGSGAVNDNSTSSPLVAPDGSIYYGSFTRYNYVQGHLMRFSSTGQFLNSYPFGWDVTPALWKHDGTFSLVTKENRYEGAPSYCPSCAPNRIPGNEEGYLITQLSPSLQVEWQFRSPNVDDERPVGYEWCVNAPAVDRRGVVYVNSEDGNLYAIDQGGTLRESIFLKQVLGAAYTPLSIGADGRIYTQNAGVLFAVGEAKEERKQRAVRH